MRVIRILKIALYIIGFVFVTIIELLRPVKYFEPNKGKFGSKVTLYKTLVDSSGDM